jgi:hypothetical protein
MFSLMKIEFITENARYYACTKIPVIWTVLMWSGMPWGGSLATGLFSGDGTLIWNELYKSLNTAGDILILIHSRILGVAKDWNIPAAIKVLVITKQIFFYVTFPLLNGTLTEVKQKICEQKTNARFFCYVVNCSISSIPYQDLFLFKFSVAELLQDITCVRFKGLMIIIWVLDKS